MNGFIDSAFDLTSLWTFCLLFARLFGLFQALPGVGTEEVPLAFRGAIVMAIACLVTMSGVQAPEAPGLAEGMLRVGTEYAFGYLIGFVPQIVIHGIAIGGQVSAGAIGLAQAMMMDPSLGTSVTTLARLQTLLTTMIFLGVDGHHVVIRVALGATERGMMWNFRPDQQTAMFLLNALEESCRLALQVSAPILVTMVTTNLIMGLITKFVSQINIFVVSFSLTILLGLYLVLFSLPALGRHVEEHFSHMDTEFGRLIPAQQSVGP